jgi:hypothetical protein
MKRVVIGLSLGTIAFLFSIAATYALLSISLNRDGGSTKSTIALAISETDVSDADGQAIYSAILAKDDASKFLSYMTGQEASVAILDETRGLPLPKGVSKQLKKCGVDESAVSDFDARLRESRSLSPYLKSIQGAVMYEAGEEFEIGFKTFNHESGDWVTVNDRTSIGGLLSLSDIAYNKDRKLALVNTGLACGSFCGGSELYVLEKSDSGWNIAGQYGSLGKTHQLGNR